LSIVVKTLQKRLERMEVKSSVICLKARSQKL
jgi:hypothetical protein